MSVKDNFTGCGEIFYRGIKIMSIKHGTERSGIEDFDGIEYVLAE